MTFTFKPAIREKVSLLIGLAGAPGSGKTRSALEIATGICSVTGGKIAVIDTEARRALHYALAPHETSQPGKFEFLHGEMMPPFTPDLTAEAVRAAAEAVGAGGVVVIDNASHEYDGEGGILEMAELSSVPSPGNWKVPKLAHKRMLNEILQLRCHVVFCMRAEEKIRIVRVPRNLDNPDGPTKNVVEQAGWKPICEKRFPYELTIMLTFDPAIPGKPNFDLPTKLQAQHYQFFPADEFINQETGRNLALWATGAAPAAEIDREALAASAKAAATLGTESLRSHWATLTKAARAMLADQVENLRALATEADKAQAAQSADNEGNENGENSGGGQ